jgi:transcriptional regulator with XRE-family HTH domain
MSMTPVDEQLQIAARVRAARRARGISQSDLGRILGVTFQQIQKYENGTNRFSAGALVTIARALDMPLSFFFEGINVAVETTNDADDTVKHALRSFLADPDSYRIARAFQAMSQRRRRAMINLAEDMAGYAAEGGK